MASLDSVSVLAPPAVRESVVARHYVRRDSIRRRLLGTADAVALLLALVAAAGVATRGDGAEFVLLGLAAIPGWITLLKLYGLYDRDVKRLSHSTVDDLPRVFHAVVVGSLLTWAFFRVLPVDQMVLSEIVTFGVCAFVAILILRSVVRSLAVRFVAPARVLLIGGAAGIGLLARKLRFHPEYGLTVIGCLTPGDSAEPCHEVSILGALDDFERVIADHRPAHIIFSSADLDESALLALVRRCKELSIKVGLLPQISDVLGPSVEVDDVEGVTILGLNPPVLSRSSRFLKRSMDVVGSVVLLIVASPLLVVIAAAIRIDTKGPVFFRQQRMGKGGTPLRLLKFRTMVPDAEALRESLLAKSSDPNWLKLDVDPRITRVGRLLRLTSLDELPQLWNVLVGDMSLVGPRPLIETEDRMVAGWGRARLDLTPGITGFWQVLGRTNIPFEEMVKLDYLYVTNWSLWTDIRLILRTLPVVLTRRGAN